MKQERQVVELDVDKLVKKPTVVKNSGSTARDHLANERTFLAWLRTSLGCIALAIPLHELGLMSEAPLTQFAGAGSLVLSVGVLTFATRRYFLNAYLLQHGYFHYNRRGIQVIAAVAFLVALSLLAIVAFAEGKSLLPSNLIVRIGESKKEETKSDDKNEK